MLKAQKLPPHVTNSGEYRQTQSNFKASEEMSLQASTQILYFRGC